MGTSLSHSRPNDFSSDPAETVVQAEPIWGRNRQSREDPPDRAVSCGRPGDV